MTAQQCSTQPHMLSLLLMQCQETLLTLLPLLSFPHLLEFFISTALMQASAHFAPSFASCRWPLCYFYEHKQEWLQIHTHPASFCSVHKCLWCCCICVVCLPSSKITKIVVPGPEDLCLSFCLWLCIIWPCVIIVSSGTHSAGSLHILGVQSSSS